MAIEHGADGGVVDLAHERGGFVERRDHIALAERQRFHQDGDAALAGLRRDGGQAFDEMPGGIGAAQTAGGAALFGRAENQDAIRPEIGAEIDQMADVLPTPAAQTGIGRGDVQALGADHEPVQADELQSFRGDDVAAFAAPGGRDRGRIFRQGEWGDLDAAVTGLADGAAGIGERPVFEDLVADGVAEAVRHVYRRTLSSSRPFRPLSCSVILRSRETSEST